MPWAKSNLFSLSTLTFYSKLQKKERKNRSPSTSTSFSSPTNTMQLPMSQLPSEPEFEQAYKGKAELQSISLLLLLS